MSTLFGISQEAHEAATKAGRLARQAYLESHPEPEVRDFKCSRCKALPGEPCDSKQAHKIEHSHLARQDKFIKAMNSRQGSAADADDDAYSAEVSQWRSDAV